MSIPKSLGRYQIECILGRGGMGVVYKAHDPLIGRDVAVKTIRKDLIQTEDSAAVLPRIEREAQAAGKLLHPNIVLIFECGEEQDVKFIVMEYVQGRELKSLLDGGAVLEPKRASKIMLQMLDALDHAHRRSIIHRDIKPANIILLDDDTVKVADFGIAKLQSSELTSSGLVLGTPSYMSPEQLTGGVLDGRSDLFSAGMILYEMLTGKKAFPGNDIAQIMGAIINSEPSPPSQVNATLSASFDGVVAKALAKDVAQRFQTAQEFAEALRLVIAGKVSAVVSWKPEALQAVEQALTKSCGPIAKMLIKKASQTTAEPEALLMKLAAHIPNEEERQVFLSATRKIFVAK